jgi:hypothetical protein
VAKFMVTSRKLNVAGITIFVRPTIYTDVSIRLMSSFEDV